MRAFHLRLIVALTPIAIAVAACADPALTGRKGVVTTLQKGSKANVVVTRPSVDTSGFGSGVVTGGVTGVTEVAVTPSPDTTSPPIYRTTIQLTVKGKAPGEWHDRRIYEGKRAYLVPRIEAPALSTLVTHESRLDFSTLTSGTYRFVYSDLNLPAVPERDAQGYQRVDMLGFFASRPLIFEGYQNASQSLKVDLYWETSAQPSKSDLTANDPLHANGEFMTYRDEFRTKPYTGVYIDSLPDYLKACKYRFVVAKSPDGGAEWQSVWKEFREGEDYVTAAWNGYSSRASGPDDDPPEDFKFRLPEGLYFFCIEFMPVAGKEPSGNFRTINAYGINFNPYYYGASQWFAFELKHGNRPSPSPAPGSSPSPSPRPTVTPTVAPTAQPGASPTPNVITI